MNQDQFLQELEADLTGSLGGKYENIGRSIGRLVDQKNKAYGDAFNKSSEFLKILYPDGVNPDQYDDMLAIVRVFDKLMRIATQKDAFGENPWEDVAGYGILKAEDDQNERI
ncbi:hypothetical protein [Siminovitchia sp. FSL W7-1587]|uniref:hypothetical protein n=1 Tax=Siminovitchia sp. FSL W7-1587 TaxID=2954699 RepID=UPI0030CD6114